MLLVMPSVELISYTPNPEKLIEQAGRVCWRSEDKITEDSHIKFISMLKDKNHDSVLEHALATFKIITDRAIANEIVRHRIGCSPSQESTRYCNYSKDKHNGSLTFVPPSEFINMRLDNPKLLLWMESCRLSEKTYLELIDLGVKPEDARSVLPLCTKTELFETMNFRALRHFIYLRTSPAAHPDIRILALEMQRLAIGIAPTVFGD